MVCVTMINGEHVLGALWSGKVRAIENNEAKTFCSMFRALFPARSIILAIEEGALVERVLLDDTEVMPALTLGDVIAEELNLNVPYGAAIVFVPGDALADGACSSLRGEVLGGICAQIIMETINRGSFPMEREIDVSFRLGGSAVAIAQSFETRTGIICLDAFHRGLATTLGECMFAGSANLTGPTLDDMLCLHARSAAAGTPLLVDGQYSMPFESWLAAVSRAAADRPLQAKRTEALRTSKI